jgi:hypothetical protein
MSSYGQHAPSSSFQQDSALVAQFASYDHPERDPRSSASSDIPEAAAAWNDSIPHERRPKRLTIGGSVYKPEAHASTNERSPLLRKPSVSRIREAYEGGDGRSDHDLDYRRTFFDEVKTLAKYTLPVFGCAFLFFPEVTGLIPSLIYVAEPMFWRCSLLHVDLDAFVLIISVSTHSLLPVPSPLATSPPML